MNNEHFCCAQYAPKKKIGAEKAREKKSKQSIWDFYFPMILQTNTFTQTKRVLFPHLKCIAFVSEYSISFQWHEVGVAVAAFILIISPHKFIKRTKDAITMCAERCEQRLSKPNKQKHKNAKRMIEK